MHFLVYLTGKLNFMCYVLISILSNEIHSKRVETGIGRLNYY